MTSRGKRGLYLKKNALPIRISPDYCGGCSIFKPDNMRCQDPILDKIWKTCSCKECLIKGMCNNECGPLQKHRNRYVNKQKKIKEQNVAKTLERFIDNKPHGGIGEVA